MKLKKMENGSFIVMINKTESATFYTCEDRNAKQQEGERKWQHGVYKNIKKGMMLLRDAREGEIHL